MWPWTWCWLIICLSFLYLLTGNNSNAYLIIGYGWNSLRLQLQKMSGMLLFSLSIILPLLKNYASIFWESLFPSHLHCNFQMGVATFLLDLGSNEIITHSKVCQAQYMSNNYVIGPGWPYALGMSLGPFKRIQEYGSWILLQSSSCALTVNLN